MLITSIYAFTWITISVLKVMERNFFIALTWTHTFKKQSFSINLFGTIHIKPQTCRTPDTSNQRHIKPWTKNIGLPTTHQIKIPFNIPIEILFENLKINWIFTLFYEKFLLSQLYVFSKSYLIINLSNVVYIW